MSNLDSLFSLIPYSVGDVCDGFKIESIEPMDEYQAVGITAVHQKSGLRLFHFYNDDRENLFSFCFKTPPVDDTGVAHIIEHSVLSGSKRFPVKDPFQSFLKGSVNTFLNAMTYPEKTLYPAATVHEKDYFNLMDVYGDAVFHPLLTREIFEQEAYRIDKSDDGTYHATGIVYNEMQGSYSDKERLMFEHSCQVLFPDTVYQYDSGGVPFNIPELTYEQFLEFHKEYYHPTNCSLFLYGNIASERQFKFLDERILCDLKKEEGHCADEIKLQPSWDAPKHYHFSAPRGEDDDESSMSTVNWVVGAVESPLDALAYDLLSSVLLDNSSSPLYKGLLATGLGEDLSPSSGMDSSLRQAIFSCGLRGMKIEDCEGFDKIVINILSEIVKEGLHADAVEASLRLFEFRLREIRGGIPNGLRMMDRSLSGWIHGAGATDFLKMKDNLKQLRLNIEQIPNYLETMIQRILIDNNHQAQVTLTPDEKEGERNAQQMKDVVEAVLLRERQIDSDYPENRIQAFSRHQNKKESQEALDKMPRLLRSDISTEILSLELQLDSIESDKDNHLEKKPVEFAFHPCNSNQITYYSIVFDLGQIKDDDSLLIIPLLARMMSSAAVGDLDYHEVARKSSLLTGALYPLSESGTRADSFSVERDDNGDIAKLIFKVKVLDERVDEALPWLFDLITLSKMDDKAKLKELILEAKNDYRSSIVPDAAEYALSRSRSGFSKPAALAELWRGLSQFALTEWMGEIKDKNMDQLCDAFESLRLRLFRSPGISFSVTSDAKMKKSLKDHSKGFLNQIDLLLASKIDAVLPPDLMIKSQLDKKFEWSRDVIKPGDFQLFKLPVGVACNSLTVKGVDFPDELAIPMQILSMLMNTDYLWSVVRMQGGAYGSSSSLNSLESYFSFYSYRDPSITATFEAFRKALVNYHENRVDQGDIDQAVITIAGRELRPFKPAEQGAVAWRRHLYGVSDELRKEKRAQLLAVNVESIQAAAGKLLDSLSTGCFVSFAGPEALAKDISNLKKPLKVLSGSYKEYGLTL